MGVAKTIEINSSSTTSFQDAIETGIKTAGESLDAIKSAWVRDQVVEVEGGEIKEYRVRMRVTFVLH